MMKKSANSVGVFLGARKGVKSMPGFAKVEAPEPAEAEAPVADLIAAYLQDHPGVTPAALVAALGRNVSEVMAALTEMERFGFVTLTEVDGKIAVDLPKTA